MGDIMESSSTTHTQTHSHTQTLMCNPRDANTWSTLGPSVQFALVLFGTELRHCIDCCLPVCVCARAHACVSIRSDGWQTFSEIAFHLSYKEV